MADPFNYSALLGQGQQLVPNVLDQEIQRSLGRAQIEQTQANTALLGQKMRQSLVETQEQQEYSRQVEEALASGDPFAIPKLLARFPQFKDALKTSYDQMDTLKQQSEMRQAAGIWSYLHAGNVDGAVKMLRERVDSDKAAGEDTSEDEKYLAMLESGDQRQINTVKGLLASVIASVRPDNYASVIGKIGTGTPDDYTIGPGGQRRSGATNEIIASAPFAPRPVILSDGQIAYNYAPEPPQPGPPPPPPPSGAFGFVTPDQARSIAQGADFLAWQRQYKTPVLVNSPEEAAAFPPGTLLMNRDGRTGIKR